MALVERFVVFEIQKELTATGVASGMRHRDRTGKVSACIRDAAFAFDFIAGAASADTFSLKAAALGNKVLDHTMKKFVLVVARLNERNEIANRVGCFVFEQLQHDVSSGRLQFDSR